MFFERLDRIHAGRFAALYRDSRFVHGFSTRKGGVSAPPYASLNLGTHGGDEREAVDRNRERFCAAMRIPKDRLAVPRQVHGDRIAEVTGPGPYPETDALITDVPGVFLAVQTADCVPVWLVDRVKRAVGLVHAGWRGSALRIAGQTVGRMETVLGASPADLFAFLGPSIGPCCYEVGDGVRDAFSGDYSEGKNLNLWRIVEDQLLEAGVPRKNMEISGLCTACHPEWFYSHRRSGDGRTGRMMAILGVA